MCCSERQIKQPVGYFTFSKLILHNLKEKKKEDI